MLNFSVSIFPNFKPACDEIFNPFVPKCELYKIKTENYLLAFEIVMFAPLIILLTCALSQPASNFAKKAIKCCKKRIFKPIEINKYEKNSDEEDFILNIQLTDKIQKKYRITKTIKKVIIFCALLIPSMIFGLITHESRNILAQYDCEDLKDKLSSTLAFGLSTLVNSTFISQNR